MSESLTNKVLELVSNLVVHSSIIPSVFGILYVFNFLVSCFLEISLSILPCVSLMLLPGIGGLASDIISSATVSSTLACPAFTEMLFDATPILHVAVEPRNTGGLVIHTDTYMCGFSRGPIGE